MGKIKEKAIRAIIVYEIIGRPADYIEKVMNVFLDRIKDKKDVELIKKEIFPVREIEKVKDLYSIVAETEFYFKDIEVLLGFMIDTMPSSIEIIEPKEIKFNLSKINAFVNDYLATLHRYDDVFKKLKLEREILIKKINELEEKIKKSN
ncbi:MAG: hypothetical protein QXQ30_01215 [Candidatus Pacearchaeota archaeon]